MGKNMRGIGTVYTYDYKLRNPKTRNVGFGYYDPNKVFFKEDPNGYVMVDGKLVSLTDTKVDPSPVDPYTYEQIGDKVYKTIKVGNSIWMAENLDFKWEGLNIGSDKVFDSDQAACYINDDETTWGWNGRKCGLMYNEKARIEIEDHIEGWHIPTSEDRQELYDLIYSEELDKREVYKIVPPNSEVPWGDYTNEFPDANETLLSFLPVGAYHYDTLEYLGQAAHIVQEDSYEGLDDELVKYTTVYDIYFPGTPDGDELGWVDPGWGTWNEGAVEIRLVKDK